MPAITPVRSMLAAASLCAIVAGAAFAADPAPALSSADASAAYLETFRKALPEGWLQGDFKAWNDAGTPTNDDTSPQCISGAHHDDLPLTFKDLIDQLGSAGGTCKVTAYEPGTLRLALNCVNADKTFNFDSSGTFAEGQIDVAIKLKATGPGAPDLGSMHLIAKRLRACTAEEQAQANAPPPQN